MSFPLALADIGIEPIEAGITAQKVESRTEAPTSLKEQIQVYPGERWWLRFVYPPLTRRQAGKLIAFRLELHTAGGAQKFLAGDPLCKQPQGVATGTPVVNGASQTGNTLLTTGWTPSTTGILLAYDYIMLGAGATARLHMNLNDADSDGAGAATLTLWPALRESPLNAAAITTVNPVGVFRWAEPDWEWSLAAARARGLVLRGREVV